MADVSNLKDRYLFLPLGDLRLLGPSPYGCFTLQVRGRLGQDATFRVCVLPEIKFHLPLEALLPDPNTGSQDLSLTLESPHLRELTVEPPAVLQDSTSHTETGGYQVVVPAESVQVALRSRFSVGEETVEIPLTVAVPRLRWTVSGLSETGSLHWHDRLIRVSLQELEEAQEPRLLVQGDFGQDIVCTLLLQEADHQKRFGLKDGRGGCPLSPFLDSLRENGFPRNHFDLEFSLPGEDGPRRVRLIQVETTEEQQDQAQEEIAALYAQAHWQSLDSARRFLQHLRSISGELAYGEQRLLKLEGVVARYGEDLLRWWGGEKKEKGIKTPLWVYIPLKEVGKILPGRLRLTEMLCLTATLQRAGAYGALSLPGHVAERVNFWGCFFCRAQGQEYRRELRWAEETFAR
jgi:hypothetical protein